MAEGKIAVKVHKGEELVDRIVSDKRSLTIGSDPSADIVLDGDDIGTLHAVIELNDEGDLILTDKGSEAGTILNGKRIKRKAFVEDGDVVEIGGYELHFSLAGHVEEDAPAVAEEPEEPADSAPHEIQEVSDEEFDEIHEVGDEDLHEEPLPEGGLVVTLIPETTAEDRKGARVLEVREILWGDTLFKVDQYFKLRPLTFGEAKGTDYFIPSDHMPSDAFELITVEQGDLVLNFTDIMEGYVERDGDRMDLEDLRRSSMVQKSPLSTAEHPVYSLPLKQDDLVLISVGPVTFYFRQVSRGKILKESILKHINYAMLVILLLCAAAIGGLFATASLTYVEGEEKDFFDVEDRFAKVIMNPEVKKKEEKPKPEKKAKPKKALLRQGRKSVGREGKVGRKDSKVAMSKGTPRKAINDEEVASSSGILGLLASNADQDLNAVFGGGGLGGSLDKNLGGLAGPSGVDMRGTGGLGLRGTGTGGGGTGLGIGGIGTWGRGGGRAGYGSGHGRLGGHRRTRITTSAAAAVVKGALAKSVIASVIRRYYNRIKYCYQKELTRNPNLYGKIKVYFVISGTGRVSESRVIQTTMNNRNVEDCVAGVIRQIRFPKPKGGGIVVVKFPFVFRATE